MFYFSPTIFLIFTVFYVFYFLFVEILETWPCRLSKQDYPLSFSSLPITESGLPQDFASRHGPFYSYNLPLILRVFIRVVPLNIV